MTAPFLITTPTDLQPMPFTHTSMEKPHGEVPGPDSDNVLDLSEELNTLTKSDAVMKLAAHLEPLPATVSRLMALNANACDLADVAGAIRMDPVLTLKILRTANSAFSASSLTVSTVDEAVMRLGLGLIISMALAVSVGKTMSTVVPAYGLAAGQLWRHSATAAIAAEILVRLAPHTVPPATVTAALLHDVGKLIVAQSTSADEMAFVHRARQEAGLSLFEAETEVLEMNHAEVGYIIAQHWNLPERICRAIMYHHDPGQWDDRMGDAVHLANLAAGALEAAENDAPPGDQPAPEVLDRLGLRDFDFEKFCAQCARRFTQLRALYGA